VVPKQHLFHARRDASHPGLRPAEDQPSPRLDDQQAKNNATTHEQQSGAPLAVRHCHRALASASARIRPQESNFDRVRGTRGIVIAGFKVHLNGRLHMRRSKPGVFDTFLFADYSGAEAPAAQRTAISLFRLDTRDPAPRKIRGPFVRATLREAIVEQIETATREGRRVLFGIDHQWSWPRDLLGAASLSGLSWREALSRLAAGHGTLPPLGPPSVYARAFNLAAGTSIFHCRVKTLAKKYGVPTSSSWSGNPVRLVETLTKGAKPATRLGGTGAVAGQTLAGLRELRLLVGELERRGLPFKAWPFDTLHDDGRSHIGCEIYPGYYRRDLIARGKHRVRPGWSEHDRDAALSCVWARSVRLAASLDLRRESADTREVARIEGWILGASTP